MKHPAISIFIAVIKGISWLVALAGLIGYIVVMHNFHVHGFSIVAAFIVWVIITGVVVVWIRILPELLSMFIRIDNNLDRIANQKDKSQMPS